MIAMFGSLGFSREEDRVAFRMCKSKKDRKESKVPKAPLSVVYQRTGYHVDGKTPCRMRYRQKEEMMADKSVQ